MGRNCLQVQLVAGEPMIVQPQISETLAVLETRPGRFYLRQWQEHGKLG